MKRLVSLALSAALVLSLLAGCGNSTDPQTTGTATTGGNEGTGEAKDTIVWAQSGDINSLDFHVGKQYLSYGVTCNIFDTLVSWDADNNVIPMLATEWEFLDEDSIQFKLREGVTFHDGEPFTAEDVKYTYERARDHTIVKNNFSWLESVDVVDDYTVVINTIGAYSPVLNALCSPLCGIMPKHLMEANENAMAEFPIGTGPYKFVERAEGEYIKMEANEDYWGGTPKTKYLEMRVVPETSQRSVLLETGEIDFAYDVLPSDVERLNGNENLQVLEDVSFKTFYLTLNCTSEDTPALQDARVRMAIECAIDKDTLCDAVMYGYAEPIGTLLAPGVFGYSESVPANTYDVERAKELLAEAGYADGFSMSIWVQSSDQTRQEACIVIQDMLREVGIEASVEPMDSQVMDDRMVKGEDFGMSSSMWYNLIGDADYAYYSNISPESTSNFAHYNNPELLQELLDARSIQDDTQRAAVYDHIGQVLSEERPYIPMWSYNNLVGASKTQEGFQMNPVSAYRYENVVVYE